MNPVMLFEELKCVSVQLSHEGNVAWVTLNRPDSYNALNAEMIKEIHDVIGILEHSGDVKASGTGQSPGVRVVILQGSGKSFCAGIDIKAADQDQKWEYNDLHSQIVLSRLVERLRGIPQPIISIINGPAVGAGLALALVSDIRIGSNDSLFLVGFSNLGLSNCDVGTSYLLPRIVGQAKAAEMMLTGKRLDSAAALKCGLLSHLVAKQTDLQKEASRCAENMLKMSKWGLILTKKQMQASMDCSNLHAAITAENSHQMYLMNRPDVVAMARQHLQRTGSRQSKM